MANVGWFSIAGPTLYCVSLAVAFEALLLPIWPGAYYLVSEKPMIIDHTIRPDGSDDFAFRVIGVDRRLALGVAHFNVVLWGLTLVSVYFAFGNLIV